MRMHHKVQTVAEISKDAGTHIGECWIQHCTNSLVLSLDWSLVEKPLEKMWKSWKLAVQMVTNEHSRLKDHLGSWCEMPIKRTYSWMQDDTHVSLRRRDFNERKENSCPLKWIYIGL